MPDAERAAQPSRRMATEQDMLDAWRLLAWPRSAARWPFPGQSHWYARVSGARDDRFFWL